MKRLLVGYDGSAHALEAVRQAAHLALQTGVRVTVLTIGPVPGASAAVPAPIEAAALATAEDGASMLRRHGVAAEARGVLGAPSEVLLEAARREGYDLLLVGHGGRSGLTQLLLGSVAKRVAAAAPCPVLVVRGPAPETIDHILVGVTRSAPSQRAAEAAIMLARACGARLTLLHVVSTELLATAAHAHAMAYLRVFEEADGKAALAWLSQQCQQAGVEADTLQATGPTVDVVLTLARERDAQVIAIGRPDRTSLGRLVLGSTSDAILRGAKAAVLITGERTEALKSDAAAAPSHLGVETASALGEARTSVTPGGPYTHRTTSDISKEELYRLRPGNTGNGEGWHGTRHVRDAQDGSAG